MENAVEFESHVPNSLAKGGVLWCLAVGKFEPESTLQFWLRPVPLAATDCASFPEGYGMSDSLLEE